MDNNRSEMGTHVNQLKQNNNVNMNNLVKNLENNIENIERMRNLETNTSSYKVGGYQMEHQQLINQSMNPVIIEQPNISNGTNYEQQMNEANKFSIQNGNNIMNSLDSKDGQTSHMNKNSVHNKSNYSIREYFFNFLNKEFLIITLLFSLLSHRKFNTLLSKYLPIIADTRFYTIYIIFKGVVFSLILSFFKKN